MIGKVKLIHAGGYDPRLGKSAHDPTLPSDPLTLKQRQVLDMLDSGHSIRTIAQILNLSLGGVKGRIARARKSLKNDA